MKNRDLLRSAGEHVGTLAEEAKIVYERYASQRGARITAGKFYNRYVKLLKLSKDVLEIANE